MSSGLYIVAGSHSWMGFWVMAVEDGNGCCLLISVVGLAVKIGYIFFVTLWSMHQGDCVRRA